MFDAGRGVREFAFDEREVRASENNSIDTRPPGVMVKQREDVFNFILCWFEPGHFPFDKINECCRPDFDYLAMRCEFSDKLVGVIPLNGCWRG